MLKRKSNKANTSEIPTEYLIAILYFTSLSLHQFQFEISTTNEVARYRTDKGNRDVFYIIITVASWLVRSTPKRAVRVRALAGDIVLSSWARHFTLTVPLRCINEYSRI